MQRDSTGLTMAQQHQPLQPMDASRFISSDDVQPRCSPGRVLCYLLKTFARLRQRRVISMKKMSPVFKCLSLGLVVSILFCLNWWSTPVKRFAISVDLLQGREFHLRTQPPSVPENKLVDFQRTVRRLAKDNAIIITSTDYFSIDVALNFYYTSFQKFGITNFVFGCTHPKAFDVLQAMNISSFLLRNLTVGEQHTTWRSADFNQKTYPRNDLVLAALEAGLSVFVVDIDVIFSGNPLPFLLETYKNYDIATSQEHYNFMTVVPDVIHCIGMYFVNPTKTSVELHTKMKWFQTRKIGSNQQVMNHVMRNILQNELNVAELDPQRFYDGFAYFRDIVMQPSCCQFASDSCCPRDKYLVLHSNNAKPKPSSKIYKFKEHLMWVIDNKRYYSDPERKYLQMSLEGPNLDRAQQQRALSNGFQLAAFLNRTLIFPKFYYKEKHCNFLGTFPFCIKNLDELMGVESYREHMFLHHHQVPKEVKTSVSKQEVNLHTLLTSFYGNFQDINTIKSGDQIKEHFLQFKDVAVVRVSVTSDVILEMDTKLQDKLHLILDEGNCIPWWRKFEPLLYIFRYQQ